MDNHVAYILPECNVGLTECSFHWKCT